jgi:hypothetical protein
MKINLLKVFGGSLLAAALLAAPAMASNGEEVDGANQVNAYQRDAQQRFDARRAQMDERRASMQQRWDARTNDHSLSLEQQAQSVLQEHVVLGGEALRADLQNSRDKQAVMQAVEENNQAVANTIDALYPGTHDQFLAGWRAHIGYYADYLHAAVRGDEAGKVQARQNVAGVVDQATNLLSQTSPWLDAATLRQQLTEHGDQTFAIIDAMVAGDYPRLYELSHEAYMHMAMVAQTLYDGRVR